MTDTAGQAERSGDAPCYSDRPNRSPWITQFEPDGAPRPLGGDATADVVIVGAGIAGIATAFFLLRECPGRVLLVERDRVARGASGRNAGQLTTYFERPLSELAERFGRELVGEAQRGFEDAHELLDLMVATSGATVRVERFSGHMGMFNRHHLEVHLSSLLIRERAGLPPQTCLVSEDAEFLPELPARFAGLYDVVPRARIRELLEVGTTSRYAAVLSARAGCANSGLLCQQVLRHLERGFSERFHYADHTDAERIVVGDDGVVVHAAVTASWPAGPCSALTASSTTWWRTPPAHPSGSPRNSGSSAGSGT